MDLHTRCILVAVIAMIVDETAASQEPAWITAGQKPGLQIWRIVNFKVEEWPKEDYGKFYDGDSYIILNTYKKEDSEAMLYDVHFWIGKRSTKSEYETAALRTVELVKYLNDVPIQHREVQGHESELFKSYFPAITYLNDGAESGPKECKPRLLHFHGDHMGVTVTELYDGVQFVLVEERTRLQCTREETTDLPQIQRPVKNIDDDDVYILDLGLTLFQYNGNGSNRDERSKAMQYVNDLKTERSGKVVTLYTLDQVTGGKDEFLEYVNPEEDEEDSESVVDC